MKRLTAAGTIVALLLLMTPGIAFAEPPSNDDFDNADEITWFPGGFPTITVDTDEATEAPDDPDYFGQQLEKTVWFRFNPPTDGVYTISTRRSTYQPTIFVFVGSRGALEPADVNFEAWLADAETTYFIEAGSMPGTPGGFLSLYVEGPLSAEITVDDAKGRIDPRTRIATVTGTVTCIGEGPIGGRLRQQVRQITISGGISINRPICDGRTRPWVGKASGDNGRFAPGQAEVSAEIEVCASAFYCEHRAAERTIRLTF